VTSAARIASLHHAWSGSAGVGAIVTALVLAASRPSVSARAAVDLSVGDAQRARLWRTGGSPRVAGVASSCVRVGAGIAVLATRIGSTDNGASSPQRDSRRWAERLFDAAEKRERAFQQQCGRVCIV
jgi:hypothetical protein